MKLNQLIKTTTKPKRRLGRGLGSGRGKTSGRGTKGQKARGRIPVGFTGSGLPTYKKLPLRRGLGNPARSAKPVVVSLSDLSGFKANSIVTIEELIKLKVITPVQAKRGVKVLGKGELAHPLTVKLPVSKSAKAAIEQKGGKVENV